MRFTTSIETWKAWEGHALDGKFTLGQWLGGSDHSAVFATEQSGQPSSKVVIKLIAPEPGQAEVQLSRWRAAAQLSHSNLIRIFATGQCKLDETQLLYVVMEQAEEDLSQILPQRALSPDEIRRFASAVARCVSLSARQRFCSHTRAALERARRRRSRQAFRRSDHRNRQHERHAPAARRLRRARDRRRNSFAHERHMVAGRNADGRAHPE